MKEEKQRLEKEMKEKQRQQQEMIREKIEEQKKQSEEDSRWLEEEESKSDVRGLLSPVGCLSKSNHVRLSILIYHGVSFRDVYFLETYI